MAARGMPFEAVWSVEGSGGRPVQGVCGMLNGRAWGVEEKKRGR
jgi:hypothetical protein